MGPRSVEFRNRVHSRAYSTDHRKVPSGAQQSLQYNRQYNAPGSVIALLNLPQLWQSPPLCILGHRGTIESMADSSVESTVEPTVASAVELSVESILESILESTVELATLHSFPKANT